MAKQWHPTKNNELKSSDITPGSHKKAWWICEKGHEWEALIKSRNVGIGCPYCSNQKVGYGNDLQTNNPDLAKQWHPIKNELLKPSDVSQNSNKKVWWICGKGHEWEAIVNSRNSGNGCSKCSHQTSKMDKVLYFYTKKLFLNTILRGKVLNNKLEADVLIPDLKIIIEYDGYRYHKDILEKDVIKRKLLVDNGYKIFILKEEGLKCLEENCVFFQIKQRYKNNFEDNIKILFQEHLSLYLDDKIAKDFINIDRDNIEILGDYENNFIENSIAKNKKLIKEWNFKKNINLKPESFSIGSNEKVWWICEEGHEWNTIISNRRAGGGCPYCSNRLLGYGNDLLTRNPGLSKEWHPTKNGELKPSEVFPNTVVKVWWICSEGHEWKSEIGSRNNGKKCPGCSGRMATKENNLKILKPEIAKDWDYIKNINLKPEDYKMFSGKKIWWVCDSGHSEYVRIFEKVAKNGCTECKKIIKKQKQKQK